ncbi:hypothetical protein CONLIGDRAFT_685956 [Coniochaeta ligniaria NRRL 30616]|uniref:Uncharacterized protein n=1 Tax=Coniochaeta ligniaria NRRL 30616 TaxID=1408157 RepID=A0A1J7J5B3_9PEZI|nr:hypothetical protein CONLIGDRAFT_685956 [Coniochaeta ligniaria NRRL 30616]
MEHRRGLQYVRAFLFEELDAVVCVSAIPPLQLPKHSYQRGRRRVPDVNNVPVVADDLDGFVVDDNANIVPGLDAPSDDDFDEASTCDNDLGHDNDVQPKTSNDDDNDMQPMTNKDGDGDAIPPSHWAVSLAKPFQGRPVIQLRRQRFVRHPCWTHQASSLGAVVSNDIYSNQSAMRVVRARVTG